MPWAQVALAQAQTKPICPASCRACRVPVPVAVSVNCAHVCADDHDYGWNNGNGRLPGKERFKGLFLDAIGEPGGSSRRNAGAGLQVCTYAQMHTHSTVCAAAPVVYAIE